MEFLANAFGQLSVFDRFVVFANLFLLIFSGPMANWLAKAAPTSRGNRLIALRIMSAALLVVYALSIFTEVESRLLCPDANRDCDVLRQLSLTGLVILAGYALYIGGHAWLLRRYGRTREIEGQAVFSVTYQAEMLSLLFLVGIIIVGLLMVLSIWGMQNWLEKTSVLGALALLLFFTKDVWLPDNIGGLILLYNGDVEPGAVIRAPELDLLGVVLKTSLMQTTLRDLTHRHVIIIPNTRLRGAKLEVLSRAGGGGLRDYIDFNIGYDAPAEQVQAMLQRAWELACDKENAVNKEQQPATHIWQNGDHAITWRLFFTIGNVYRLNQARMAINHGAHLASVEAGIGLNTPLTHRSLDHEPND
ncbi:MAG: mechanosensitive ion channel family protein [Xanthomonadales bacterium]|nr:mechanosensitive ion channel family protein [Xanthomonadales bacterium]